MVHQLYDKNDTNKDGLLSFEEFKPFARVMLGMLKAEDELTELKEETAEGW